MNYRLVFWLRFLHQAQLEIPALESVIEDIFQNDWISDSRVNEHRSVQSIMILNGAVTVTSYLICVFDTEALLHLGRDVHST